MKKIIDKSQFMELLKDGMTIMVGGFMTSGTPEVLIDYIVEKNVKDLTIICNDAGYPNEGVGKLIRNDQVKKLIASHIGLNKEVAEKMNVGLMEVELIPQGTLIEQIRAYGAGLGGILTPTGVHTIVDEGKQKIVIKDKTYLLEEAIGADLSLVKAHKSDRLGNLTYYKTARNFNPAMATASKVTVATFDEFVPEIDPECVITPHIFINYLVRGEEK